MHVWLSRGYTVATVTQALVPRPLPDERNLLRHLVQEVAAELFIIRARDQRELLQAIATGLIDPDKASERARLLVECL